MKNIVLGNQEHRFSKYKRKPSSYKIHVGFVTFKRHTKRPSDKDAICFVEGMATQERPQRSTPCVKSNREDLALPLARIPPHDPPDKHEPLKPHN